MFDQRQVRYLRALGVIEFVEERTREDKFENLVRAMDWKLQLDLIPFPSTTFSPRGLTPDVIRPYMQRILDTIVTVPRTFVLFCGPCSARC